MCEVYHVELSIAMYVDHCEEIMTVLLDKGAPANIFASARSRAGETSISK
jgi:hypothetical protein